MANRTFQLCSDSSRCGLQGPLAGLGNTGGPNRRIAEILPVPASAIRDRGIIPRMGVLTIYGTGLGPETVFRTGIRGCDEPTNRFSALPFDSSTIRDAPPRHRGAAQRYCQIWYTDCVSGNCRTQPPGLHASSTWVRLAERRDLDHRRTHANFPPAVTQIVAGRTPRTDPTTVPCLSTNNQRLRAGGTQVWESSTRNDLTSGPSPYSYEGTG